MNTRASARRALWLLASVLALGGCGGSISLAFGDVDVVPHGTPAITITVPTSASTIDIAASSISLGGSVLQASRVRVQNATTGEMVEFSVPFRGAWINWTAPALLVVPGDNLFIATADVDGSGVRTSADTLTVRRPF